MSFNAVLKKLRIYIKRNKIETAKILEKSSMKKFIATI